MVTGSLNADRSTRRTTRPAPRSEGSSAPANSARRARAARDPEVDRQRLSFREYLPSARACPTIQGRWDRTFLRCSRLARHRFHHRPDHWVPEQADGQHHELIRLSSACGGRVSPPISEISMN